MEDLEKILKIVESIRNNLGIGAAVICLITLMLIFFLWIYLKRKIENSANIQSDRVIKQFQSKLDKEFHEFSVRLSHNYQNQAKAIDEIYSQFAALTSYLEFLNKGDKYEELENPFEDLAILVKYRRDFINIFEQRKIYIPEPIKQKIVKLMPVLDAFVDTYKSGLLPTDSSYQIFNSNTNETLIIAGMWNQNRFNQAISDFKSIQDELEQLFRSTTNE